MAKSSKIIPGFHQGFGTYGQSKTPELWRRNELALAPFLGKQGKLLFDQSAFRRHTDITGPAWIIKNGRRMISYNGSTDFLQSTGYKGLIGSQDRTITAWIQTSNSIDQTIMHFGTNAATPGGRKYEFRIDSANGDVLRTEITAAANFATTGVADGKLHFVGSVLRGTNINQVKHYLDGFEDPIDSSSSVTVNTVPDKDLIIGARNFVPFDRFFNGFIGAVMLWSRALSAVEMIQLYINQYIMFEQVRSVLANVPLIEAVEAIAAISHDIRFNSIQEYGI
jgi:hypothetical protein